MPSDEKRAVAVADERLTTTEWIDRVAALRNTDDLLARGWWCGYTNADPWESAPMRGRYILVRQATPQVAVSACHPGDALEHARKVERALG